MIKIDDTRSYLLEEIKHNDLMSEKYEMICKYLNYVENMLILVSTVTGCFSVSANFFCGIHYTKTMETYCVSFKKNTAKENSSVRKTKQSWLMLLSNLLKIKNFQMITLKWLISLTSFY